MATRKETDRRFHIEEKTPALDEKTSARDGRTKSAVRLILRNERDELVNRVKSVTGALCAGPDAEKREALLDELGVLTRILTDLVVAKKGRLRNPAERPSRRLHLVVRDKTRWTSMLNSGTGGAHSSTTHQVEGQFARCYPVAAELEYTLAAGEPLRRGRRWTVTVSNTAIVFEAEESLPRRSPIELSIACAASLNGEVGLQLWISGTVIEIQAGRVTVAILGYEFRTRSLMSYKQDGESGKRARAAPGVPGPAW
jgi:hypothetical protein